MSLGIDGVERAWGDMEVEGNSLVREPSFVGVGLYDADNLSANAVSSRYRLPRASRIAKPKPI